nr:uncharacterized protein LOC112204583 isoform X1 [Pan troglodytes]
MTPAPGPAPPAVLPAPPHPRPHPGPSPCEPWCPGMRAEVLSGEGACTSPMVARAHPVAPPVAGAVSPPVVSCGAGRRPPQPPALFQGGWGRPLRSPEAPHGSSWAGCLPPVGSDATWADGVFPAQGGRASALAELPPRRTQHVEGTVAPEAAALRPDCTMEGGVAPAAVALRPDSTTSAAAGRGHRT